MDKKTKKELQRLRNLTDAEKNLLGGLYGDFFGEKAGSSSQKPADEKKPTAAQLLDLAGQRKDTAAASGNSEKVPEAGNETDHRSTGRSGDTGTDSVTVRQEENAGIDPGDVADMDMAPETAAALSDARKAVREAQDLIAGTDELTRKLSPAPDVKPETGNDQQPAESERDPMEELDSLIGLDAIKKDVRELMDFVKIQKLRKDNGLKSVPVSLHLVFTGNPGTGKTTVARIIARLYKKIGVLSGGQLVEVDRSGLVAGYVGQTALKTQEQIGKALGGVLFIDEAYSLAQNDDAFGREAIDTILKAMEDHRNDFVVIAAGYTKPMETFINSNPGLKSRFNKYFEFPDYTVDELEQIFYLNCRKYDYVVGEETGKQIRAMIVSRRMQRQENFANAREIRNMFEDIITNQARRIAGMENPTHEDMMTIAPCDLSEEDETVNNKTDSKEGDKTGSKAGSETEDNADSKAGSETDSNADSEAGSKTTSQADSTPDKNGNMKR